MMTKTDAIELLKKMISIPSFSREEGKVADLMVETLQKHGYTASRKGNNVWAKSKDWDENKPVI